MIDEFSIIYMYRKTRKNKRRSPDAVEFELHWENNCIKLLSDIQTKSFHPTAYTFISKHPKPREVFASDFATRILHYYLSYGLRPILDKILTVHTYNNRVGMGQSACQKAVIKDIYLKSKGYTRNCYLIKIDLKGCFPNIDQQIVYDQLRNVIEKYYFKEDREELLYMLGICIFSYPTNHCYRKSNLFEWNLIPPEKSLFTKPDGTGAAIGHLIWQLAETFYFNDIALWLESEGITFEWYVDDVYFVTDNKEAFLAYILPALRKKICGI